MANIQNWDLIQTNKTSGTSKLKCPACTDTRKTKQTVAFTLILIMVLESVLIARHYIFVIALNAQS